MKFLAKKKNYLKKYIDSKEHSFLSLIYHNLYVGDQHHNYFENFIMYKKITIFLLNIIITNQKIINIIY